MLNKALVSDAFHWLAEKCVHSEEGHGELDLGRRMLLAKGLGVAATVTLGLSMADTAEAASPIWGGAPYTLPEKVEDTKPPRRRRRRRIRRRRRRHRSRRQT